MRQVDPGILAVFGPPPPDINLEEQLIVRHNVGTSVVSGIAAVCVALRFYVRIVKSANFWWDDYAIVVSLACTSVTVYTTVLAGQHGAGEHVWVNELMRFITLVKIVYAEPYIYALAVTSTKVSILLLYRRLFHIDSTTSSEGAGRVYNIMYWCATGLTAVYPLVLWITMACACRPVSHYWNQYLGSEGTCIDDELFFLVLGIVNMLNDIFILIVPIPRIWSLQLNKRTKASIVGIMLLGGLVCVSSIVRIYYLNGLFQTADVTWWMGPSFAWSSMEPAFAIISACLPTFAPLFRMGRSKTKQDSGSKFSSSNNIINGGSGIGGIGSASASASHSRMRSNGNTFAIGSLGRSNAAHSRIQDDDEIELTYKPSPPDRSHSQGSSEFGGGGGGGGKGGIMVNKQLTVVAQSRDEFQGADGFDAKYVLPLGLNPSR